jgi:hypothetical protein
MTPNNARFAKFIGLPVAGIVALSMLVGGGKDRTPATPATLAPVGCKADWTKCADNGDMANNYDRWFHAQYRCKAEATKLAKYGTSEFPWLAFSTFLEGTDYAAKGIAVLYENDAKFQNGFGAMAHVEVRCEYDLRAEKVINVTINRKCPFDPAACELHHEVPFRPSLSIPPHNTEN